MGKSRENNNACIQIRGKKVFDFTTENMDYETPCCALESELYMEGATNAGILAHAAMTLSEMALSNRDERLAELAKSVMDVAEESTVLYVAAVHTNAAADKTYNPTRLKGVKLY